MKIRRSRCGKMLPFAGQFLTLSACWAVQTDKALTCSGNWTNHQASPVFQVQLLPWPLRTNSSNQKSINVQTYGSFPDSPFPPSLPMPCESPTAAQRLAFHRGLWISIGKLPWFSAKCFRIERSAARWAANRIDNVVLNKDHFNGSFYVDSVLVILTECKTDLTLCYTPTVFCMNSLT